MDWIETSVTTTTGASDALSELLMRYGARGTQILDRMDIPQKEDWTGFGEMYGEDMNTSMSLGRIPPFSSTRPVSRSARSRACKSASTSPSVSESPNFSAFSLAAIIPLRVSLPPSD